MISVRGVTGVAIVAAVCVFLVSAAAAVNIQTVPVGNPGNAGELSGSGAGGYGPDRICGAVAYAYNIGKYEVTAGQYTAFLAAVAKTDTYGLYNTDMDTANSIFGCNIKRTGSSGSYAYSVASDWANRPVNCVNWGDAARFANWLTHGQPTGGQNLTTTEDGLYYLNGAMTDAELLAVTRKSGWGYAIPTEDEWYKAAYYKGGSTSAGYWDYPTSSDATPGQDMNDVSGNNANYGDLIGSPYYRTQVGDFENSESPYGTFDQGGNVSEWNEAILYGSLREFRGGSFDYYGPTTLRASSRDYYGSHYPSSEYGYIGFRISEVPEPATLSLLAVGGLVALRRRR
jgi:sulfatase modifying factor 1